MMADADLLPPREHERELFIAMCERARVPTPYGNRSTGRTAVIRSNISSSSASSCAWMVYRAMAQQTGEILATKGPFFSGDGERWLARMGRK
jgi:hypothetical protein